MGTAREEATRELVAMLTEELPVKLTEEQVTKVQDRAYDFVGALLEAVGEAYHVVGRRGE